MSRLGDARKGHRRQMGGIISKQYIVTEIISYPNGSPVSLMAEIFDKYHRNYIRFNVGDWGYKKNGETYHWVERVYKGNDFENLKVNFPGIKLTFIYKGGVQKTVKIEKI